MDMTPHLEIVSETHPGKVRDLNEDYIGIDTQHGLIVVADGMGGYNAGEVASCITVSLIIDEVKNRGARQKLEKQDEKDGERLGARLLREGMQKANGAVYLATQHQPQYSGMGTTVVAGLLFDNKIAVAHVGDSRLYRLRGSIFESLTRDHSFLQEQVDKGFMTPSQAALSSNRHLVTRGVGVDPTVDVDVNVYDVEEDDIYLFCTDGLNDMISDSNIGSTLRALRSNLNIAAVQLVQQANDAGGRDNISIVLVRIQNAFPGSRGWGQKIGQWLGGGVA